MIDERAIILASLDDPPDELSSFGLVNKHEWRQRERLDP
jgi:hypothetical protein